MHRITFQLTTKLNCTAPTGTHPRIPNCSNTPQERRLPAAEYVKYWRVEIDQASNPDGYISVGRIIAGYYFEPELEMDAGYSLGFKDFSKRHTTTSGILRVVKHNRRRVVTARLSHITESEEATLNDLATGSEVLISAWPESTTHQALELHHTVLGFLSANTAMVRVRGLERQMTIKIEE